MPVNMLKLKSGINPISPRRARTPAPVGPGFQNLGRTATLPIPPLGPWGLRVNFGTPRLNCGLICIINVRALIIVRVVRGS